MSERVYLKKNTIGSCKFMQLAIFCEKICVCDFAENGYTCTFYDDACLNELIISKSLLVVANLCNLRFYARQFVSPVLTVLLTRFC